ncbi:MAG: hypothetical protein ACPG7W_04200 [Paracoccaceae bacterium]
MTHRPPKMPDDDDLPRKGIGYWPFYKLYGLMWIMINAAVSINTFVIWGAAKVYGITAFSFWEIMAYLTPVIMVGAYLMVLWVRSLVRDAEGR